MKKRIILSLHCVLLSAVFMAQAGQWSRFGSFGARFRNLYQKTSANVGERFRGTFGKLKTGAHKYGGWKKFFGACVVGSAAMTGTSALQDKDESAQQLSTQKSTQENIISDSAQAPAWLNDRDFKGQTPLHRAINDGDINKAKMLVAMGADLTIQDADGRTPLMLAIEESYLNSKNYRIIKLLLDQPNAQSFVNIPDVWGETPLYGQIAAFSRSDGRKVIQLLIEKGADLSMQNSVGWTPLHLAVDLGNVDAVKFILSQSNVQSFINTATTLGETPIVRAIKFSKRARGEYEKRDKEMVELLIEHGADIYTPLKLEGSFNKDFTGLNAVQIAEFIGDPELVKTIKNAALAIKKPLLDSLD